jgi:hypothetical protein
MPDDTRLVDDPDCWWEQQVALDESLLGDRKLRLARAWATIRERERHEKTCFERLFRDEGHGG